MMTHFLLNKAVFKAVVTVVFFLYFFLKIMLNGFNFMCKFSTFENKNKNIICQK